MTSATETTIAVVPPEELPGVREGLIALLQLTVEAGASLGFHAPVSYEKAATYWDGVFADVRAGKQLLLVARQEDEVVGTVQLLFATPENSQHRAEVKKMFVHPNQRRKGTGKALMLRLEAEARARNRTLLVLDTRAREAGEPLYLHLGYTRVGTIPNYSFTKNGDFDTQIFFYKQLV